MTDIVETLRVAATHPFNQHGPCEFLTEAADEITRLRAVVQRIYQCSSERRVIEMARAELERSHDR